MTHDPVATVVVMLDARLRGPKRLREDLLAEVAAGLEDATKAYRVAGYPRRHAAELACRDFGPPETVAEQFQRELVAAQGRRSARLTAVGLPGLVLVWALLWSTVWDGASAGTGVSSAGVRTLSMSYSWVCIAMAVAALAVIVLLRGGRAGAASPARLTTAIAVVSLTSAVLLLAISLARYVIEFHTFTTLLRQSALAPPAHIASVVLLAAITRSAARSFRIARTARRDS